MSAADRRHDLERVWHILVETATAPRQPLITYGKLADRLGGKGAGTTRAA